MVLETQNTIEDKHSDSGCYHEAQMRILYLNKLVASRLNKPHLSPSRSIAIMRGSYTSFMKKSSESPSAVSLSNKATASANRQAPRSSICSSVTRCSVLNLTNPVAFKAVGCSHPHNGDSHMIHIRYEFLRYDSSRVADQEKQHRGAQNHHSEVHAEARWGLDDTITRAVQSLTFNCGAGVLCHDNPEACESSALPNGLTWSS